jgi:hypothetical protein
VIVVGAGAASAVLAARQSEDCSVGVLPSLVTTSAMITYGCVSRPSLLYPRRRSANGFLPPIGSVAGVRVSVARLDQRMAEEWLTSKRLAASARLIPPATAATTRSRTSSD